MAWRMGGFPLDQVVIRSKTGSAEVYGKQSTSWVASYDRNYVVVMMVSQGGTGSRHLGPGGARDLGVALRHPGPRRRRRPGRDPRRRRAGAAADVPARRLDPAARRPEGRAMSTTTRPPTRTSTARPGRALHAPGLDWVLMAAVLALLVGGTLLVWSATSRARRADRRRPRDVPRASSWSTSPSAWC